MWFAIVGGRDFEPSPPGGYPFARDHGAASRSALAKNGHAEKPRTREDFVFHEGSRERCKALAMSPGQSLGDSDLGLGRFPGSSSS